MNRPDTRQRRPVHRSHQQRERFTRTLVVGATIAALAGLGVVAAVRDGAPATVAAAPNGFAAADAVAAAEIAAPADAAAIGTGGTATSVPTDSVAAETAIADEAATLTEDCTIAPKSLAWGATGLDVQCLQQALKRDGYYDGALTGEYDYLTATAVEEFQVEHELYVDSVAGRETARKLDIWPEEQLNVVRTPPPQDGAMDRTGYLLSPVASTGSDAPPLPANSGSGYRVVYERVSQRVWAVDEDERIVRSWLVSGSQYNNELPGTHQVYSRSEQSTAWNGKAILPYMIRWLKTDIGAIGFHGIPRHVEDNSPYQTDDELGTRLSGGCQRQNDLDAKFLWAFADVGTTVVVI